MFDKGERAFVTAPTGAWGPGCRSLEGVAKCKADIGEFLKLKVATPKKVAV